MKVFWDTSAVSEKKSWTQIIFKGRSGHPSANSLAPNNSPTCFQNVKYFSSFHLHLFLPAFSLETESTYRGVRGVNFPPWRGLNENTSDRNQGWPFPSAKVCLKRNFPGVEQRLGQLPLSCSLFSKSKRQKRTQKVSTMADDLFDINDECWGWFLIFDPCVIQMQSYNLGAARVVALESLEHYVQHNIEHIIHNTSRLMQKKKIIYWLIFSSLQLSGFILLSIALALFPSLVPAWIERKW